MIIECHDCEETEDCSYCPDCGLPICRDCEENHKKGEQVGRCKYANYYKPFPVLPENKNPPKKEKSLHKRNKFDILDMDD